jgi:non-ribosomal peptide synthetase component F
MSNVASDVAMVEAWAALLSGARLAFLPPDAAGSPDRLEEAIRQQGVTVMFLPAPLFTEIAARRPDTFRHLRCLVFGGERPNPGAVHAALHPGGLLLVHAYGHAETGGIAALHPIPGAVPEADSIPIGEPIGGAELYVLDRWLNPVPVGVPGEVYVGGPSLSLGYPGRPELTAARFVANPFRPGDRLFRTGDLARCGADGRVRLVGRLEQQVRIRGFLVNLAEVEEALKQHEDVCDAVAVVREVSAGDRRLFAYVTLRPRVGAVEEPEAALLETVRRTRPTYMVPAAVRVLSRLPLTSAGRADRDALPAIDRGTSRRG